jgi:hypothetical protein
MKLDTILANLTGFGKELDAFCSDLRDRTQDDSVRLLLYHIARWKRRIALTVECLKNTDKKGIESIPLSTEDLTFLSERVFADTFVTATAGKLELLDTVTGVLDVLVSYYEWLVRQPLNEGIRNFFQDLLTQQVDEIEQLRKLKSNVAL